MNQELLANMPALALSFKVGRAALDGNAANRLSALDFDSAGLWFAALASCGLRSVLLTLLDSDTPRSPSSGENKIKPAVASDPTPRAMCKRLSFMGASPPTRQIPVWPQPPHRPPCRA